MGNKITIKTVGKPVAFLLIGLFLFSFIQTVFLEKALMGSGATGTYRKMWTSWCWAIPMRTMEYPRSLWKKGSVRHMGRKCPYLIMLYMGCGQNRCIFSATKY